MDWKVTDQILGVEKKTTGGRKLHVHPSVHVSTDPCPRDERFLGVTIDY